MFARVWLRRIDISRLSEVIGQSEIREEEHYGTHGYEPNARINTALIKSGCFSKLQKSFVLGKVNFWELEGSKNRTPFVRIDNNEVLWEHGAVFTPYDWIDDSIMQKQSLLIRQQTLQELNYWAAGDSSIESL